MSNNILKVFHYCVVNAGDGSAYVQWWDLGDENPKEFMEELEYNYPEEYSVNEGSFGVLETTTKWVHNCNTPAEWREDYL